jgi:hypothetical protein
MKCVPSIATPVVPQSARMASATDQRALAQKLPRTRKKTPQGKKAARLTLGIGCKMRYTAGMS